MEFSSDIVMVESVDWVIGLHALLDIIEFVGVLSKAIVTIYNTVIFRFRFKTSTFK